MHESETRMQCIRAKARDGLGDLEPTLFNLLDWYYPVDKSDPQGFGCIEDLPCDCKRERMSLAHGRRDRVEEVIYQTWNKELLILPVVPRGHVVIVIGDSVAGAIAALVGTS